MRRSRFARYHEKNPTKESYIIGGLGIALAGAVGYLLYTQAQNSALASTNEGSSGVTSTRGTFVNTGGGGFPAATGSGTQVFDPNAPTTPGPVGPTTTPVGPIPGPIGP